MMLVMRWGGTKAGPAGLAVAGLIAWARFGADAGVLWASLLRGILLSAPVLYIVIPALLLYRVAEAAGGIRNIGWSVSEMTKNHILQLMILAFGFTTFLQGVAGFGVPVAVVAPLLIGIGYPPVQAVAASLLGHAWAVGMGDMASSFQALLSVTDLPPRGLGIQISILLGASGFVTAASLAHLHGGVERSAALAPHHSHSRGGGGGGAPLAQFALAWLELWIIASSGAGMLCLVLGFGMTKLRRYQGPSRPPPPPLSAQARGRPRPPRAFPRRKAQDELSPGLLPLLRPDRHRLCSHLCSRSPRRSPRLEDRDPAGGDPHLSRPRHPGEDVEASPVGPPGGVPLLHIDRGGADLSAERPLAGEKARRSCGKRGRTPSPRPSPSSAWWSWPA